MPCPKDEEAVGAIEPSEITARVRSDLLRASLRGAGPETAADDGLHAVVPPGVDSLAAAVEAALRRGNAYRGELETAAAELAATMSTPDERVAYISELRQILLRMDWTTREQVDEVVDSVLIAVVRHGYAELQDQALTDPLTGLGNRRALARDFESESARAVRTGRPLTVMVIDVNGLKALNDTGGHAVGDEALRKVGLALSSVTRGTDRAYRYGGDEFVLLLPDSHFCDASVLHDRLSEVDAPECSIGIANSSNDALDELVLIADRRLYAGRRASRCNGPGSAVARGRR